MKEVGCSDLIISPHGAITCIGAYYNKNIIDIFDRTITKNAYFEFRPIREENISLYLSHWI